MSFPSFLARLAIFAALSALCHRVPDSVSREILNAFLIVFALMVLFAPNRAFPR